MSTLLSYHSPCSLLIKHNLLIFEIGSDYAALGRPCRPGWPPTYRDLPVSASAALGLSDVSKIDSHYVARLALNFLSSCWETNLDQVVVRGQIHKII